jgi:hypothetical protein
MKSMILLFGLLVVCANATPVHADINKDDILVVNYTGDLSAKLTFSVKTIHDPENGTICYVAYPKTVGSRMGAGDSIKVPDQTVSISCVKK